MARWSPGARERLRAAALRLFERRGFDDVTASQIATEAGLTERTFFRRFPDKAAVLLGWRDEVRDALLERLRASDGRAAPLLAVADAFQPLLPQLAAEHRDSVRRELLLVRSSRTLLAQELLRSATLAEAIRLGLHHRQPPSEAAMAGRIAVIAFRDALHAWTVEGEAREFGPVYRQTSETIAAAAMRALQPQTTTSPGLGI